MQNKTTDRPDASPGGTSEQERAFEKTEQPGPLTRSLQSLLQMGLGETLIRAATNVFSLGAIVLVVWLAQSYFRQPTRAQANGAAAPSALPPAVAAPSSSLPIDLSSFGIVRQADMHTNVPERARQDI